MKHAKISFGIIVIAVIALAVVMSGLLVIVSPFEFAGFQWTDAGSIKTGDCSSSQSDTRREGEFMIITAANSGRGIYTDITGIDEVLIVYDGSGTAYCGLGVSNSGAGITAQVRGTTSGAVSLGKGMGTSRCPTSSDSVSAAWPPSIWKFKNNFDGTWSSLEGLGVGDVFIVKQTASITGNTQLYLETAASGDCGKGGTGLLRIYTIVRKENAFAVCKVNKYAYDANKDGKIAADGSECFDLSTIVLNSEEAIKESYNEKITRLTAELTAKNEGLTNDINNLKIQLAEKQSKPTPATDLSSLQQKINDLQSELKDARADLNAVKARDTNVINVIEAQEQFKKPGFIARIWNSIIAFFKDLF